MSELNQGVKLYAVWYDNGANGYSMRDGANPVQSITVVMENGQMAGVPWAKIVFDSGKIAMINLSLCTEVELLEQEPTNED